MKKYSVNSVFLTVQGEGFNAGELAVFVRFAGCNLWNGLPAGRAAGKGACARWCDTDFFDGRKYEVDQLVSGAAALWPTDRVPDRRSTTRLCVLTGGEPMLQVDSELVKALQKEGFLVAVETNGTVATEAYADLDWVCCSPKLGGKLKVDPYYVDELKVVLPGGDENIGGWTDDQLVALAAYFQAEIPKYVVPQDTIDPNMVEASYLRHNLPGYRGSAAYSSHVARCFEFVKGHCGWQVSAQSHKLLQLP